MHERSLVPGRTLDLQLTLGWLRRGPGDPTTRLAGGHVWRATRTPEGAGTTHLVVEGGVLRARAWGPGAGWVLDHLGDLVGEQDDDGALATAVAAAEPGPASRLIGQLHRRFPGLRLPRTLAVTELLVPIVLEQKVTGNEAHRSYRQLVQARGEPAPGGAERPDGLMVPPDPATLAALPYWALHPYGIERKRADTLRRVCSAASRLDALAHATDLHPEEARRRLALVPGIGAWTAAEVALVALGDADAVSVGDYHLSNQVNWALAGRARGDDASMLALLEPYRGQRGRVIRLIEAAGIVAPRYGPRRPVRSFRRR